jgi:hypothetical protein
MYVLGRSIFQNFSWKIMKIIAEVRKNSIKIGHNAGNIWQAMGIYNFYHGLPSVFLAGLK